MRVGVTPDGDAFAADALPVAAVLPALLDALRSGPNAVLVAPPGAGKTTLVPLALLDAPWRGDGTIVVLEPRRLAARAAARRMSALRGEAVGGVVGYRTRVDAAVSAATRIEVVTEGLLVARLLDDPTLDGVAAVVFDEIHERSVDADLALALCLDLQRARPELRLLAMSATADAGRLAATLGGAPVLASAGRQFPVTIRHAKRDLADWRRELPDAVARAARLALERAEPAADGENGDVLCFLPGKNEIERTGALLAADDLETLPLHGEMSPDAQDEVLRPAAARRRRRRVVLATNVAETSLTVPNIVAVVDGGFRRAPAIDDRHGLPRLATARISRAAADQRAGRAGRLGPGTCYRLWTETAHRALAPFDRPELLDADLAPLALALAGWEAAWGTDPETLRFVDAPPAGALDAARALLRALGALDDNGTITASGRAMRSLGTHPRLAAVLEAARDDGERARAAALAALLEERDPCRGAGADIAVRLALLDGGRVPAGATVDSAALGRIRDGARRFRRRLRVPEGAKPSGDPAALLAAGFPDRVAQRRGEPGAFRLSGGGGASLPSADPLSRATLLIAPGLHTTRSTAITLAAPLDPDALPASLRARAAIGEESGVDERTGSAFRRERLRLGALVLADRILPLDPDDGAAALARAARPALATVLDWSDEARLWLDRVRIARTLLGDGADPPLDPDGWDDAAERSLAVAIRRAGVNRLADLRAAIDVASLLRERLGPARAATLARLLPPALALPGGRAALGYDGAHPVASARAQCFYGLDRHPAIAADRIRPTLALLSPAGRPIALTGDLPSFWRNGWRDALRDMRGRYPRHRWPDEPWRASA